MVKIILGLLSSILLFVSCTTEEEMNVTTYGEKLCNVIIDNGEVDQHTRAYFSNIVGTWHYIKWNDGDKVKVTLNSTESDEFIIGKGEGENFGLYNKNKLNFSENNYIVAIYPSKNVIENCNYSVNTVQNGKVNDYYSNIDTPDYFVTDYDNLVLSAYENNITPNQSFTLLFKPCVRPIDAVFQATSDAVINYVSFEFENKIVSGDFYPNSINANLNFSESIYGTYDNENTKIIVNVPNITLKSGEIMRVRGYTFRVSYPSTIKVGVAFDNNAPKYKTVTNNNTFANQTIVDIKLGKIN